ncbi:unnamed protein product [Rhizophagus irregularis]|nr:unnamed protein product [Rhizophagus irregularis]CAB4408521.1 unnamed protein product [Rhizophagus irregularis]
MIPNQKRSIPNYKVVEVIDWKKDPSPIEDISDSSILPDEIVALMGVLNKETKYTTQINNILDMIEG